MGALWAVLDKIAIIGTIIGIPLSLVGIYELIYSGVIIYDMCREPNDAGGNTVIIDNYTRRDFRRGKKENPQRQYHKKGLSIDNEMNWK